MSQQTPKSREEIIRQDVHDLHRLGYAQELFRTMGGFSNFAISFSIISILTGAVILFDYGLACGGAAPSQAVVEQDDRAGQDRDDRKADGEVGEPAHRPEKLLRIPQAMQVVHILPDDLFAGLVCLLSHPGPPPTYASETQA